jgi:DNA-directed RNA polymerase specialized sigma24 family protein
MTFEEFAATQLPGVLRFAGVLTADPALAEDVVQEVLMILNEFLSWRRRSWRLVLAGRGPDVVDRLSQDHAVAHAERAALLAELGKLPRRQASALTRCLATMPYRVWPVNLVRAARNVRGR